MEVNHNLQHVGTPKRVRHIARWYKWKAKYGGMTVSELRRLKDLEAENAGLKGLLAKNS
jgi:hypothetical protein